MNKIKVISTGISLGIVLFLLNTTFTFADGQPYNPYVCTNPYGCHTPVDTGLISSQFYILGAILFIAGIILLLNVSAIKTKLNLD